MTLAACELNRTPGEPETSAPEGSFRTETSGVIGTSGPPLTPRVIITPAREDAGEDVDEATCGNGRVDSGETCDVALHDCCRTDCTGALPDNVLCRAQDGACDVEERCDGSTFTCPDDAAAGTDRECRAQAADCDAAEHCDGESKQCPEDAAAGAGTICRQPLETCDRFAACDGESMECPAFTMTVAPANTPCRVATGPCDVAEVCDGVAPSCPPDRIAAAAVECRAAVGSCDVAETCSGGSVECPPDVVLAANTICRIAAGDCDLAETCNGASGACPDDVLRAAGNECRIAGGACDIAETCSGQAVACPVDAVLARGTVCGPSRGECDATETCPGPGAGGKLCPPDVLADGIACHANAGTCSAGTCCPGLTRDAGQGCALASGDHLVFVTSRDFAGGAIGGLAPADALCDEIAATANLAGTFTAWLSNDPQGRTPANASDRLAPAAYARVDGARVADAVADLDRAIAVPIQLTEWAQSRSVPVWTGTEISGRGLVSATCADWGDPGARGELGRSGVADAGWTQFEALNCNVQAALYCFQD